MSTPLSAASSAQAQAAVNGWQQTVSAAWNQQNNLLAGGAGSSDRLGGPDIVSAQRAFFTDPAPKGAQRKIIQTNAIIPGGKDGIIVSRFYIRSKLAAAGNLYGDDRGASTNPKASARASVAWDTRTGKVSITVNGSTMTPGSVFQEQSPYTKAKHVPAYKINVGPNSFNSRDPFVNNFDVTTATNANGMKGLNIKYELMNSALPDPLRFGAVQGQAMVGVQGNNITGNLRGEDYPSREVLQYRADGSRVLSNRFEAPSGQWGIPVLGEDFNKQLGKQWWVGR